MSARSESLQPPSCVWHHWDNRTKRWVPSAPRSYGWDRLARRAARLYLIGFKVMLIDVEGGLDG